MRRSFLATAWLMTLAVSPAGRAQPPGPNLPAGPDDPWPGYVPGGRFYRNIDWGVSFWGPGQADQQLLAARGLLVRYRVQATPDRPGWAISAIASTVKQDLPADQLLRQSARQLRQRLGQRVSDIKTQPGKADSLGVGRLSCRIAPDRGGSQQSIRRTYHYMRLRPTKYLTFVGESAPTGAQAVADVLDALARSVRVFDPRQETRQITEAIARTARLVADLTPAQWSGLAGRVPPQWLRIHSMQAPPQPTGRATSPPAGQTPEPKPQPVAIGWGYLAIVTGKAGRIEAISSSRIQRDGGALASYQSFYAELTTGEEVIRDWSRSTPPRGAKAPPVETLLVARRKGKAQAAFEVVRKTTGQPEQRYSAKIQGGPYLPAAVQGLLTQRASDQRGKLLGRFSFSPLRGQVVFQTLQQVGTEIIAHGGRQAHVLQWRCRPAVRLPVAVRWTDVSGATLVRISPLPDTWADAVEEAAVPPDVRRELTRPPP